MDSFEIRKEHAHLHVTEVDGVPIVWRPLSWKDWKSYRDIAWQNPDLISEIEERIVRECVVDDTELDMETVAAGTISTLACQIINASGSVRPKDVLAHLDQARMLVRQMDEQMVLLVCKAFRYTPEEVERLPWAEFMRRVAMAEQMTGAQLQEAQPEEKPKGPEPINIEKEAGDLRRFEAGGGGRGAEPEDKPRHADLRAAYMRQRGLG